MGRGETLRQAREAGRRLGDAARLIVVAVRFATRVPLPGGGNRAGDLRRASAAFPLVGLALAVLGTGVRALAGPWWGPAVATILAVGAVVVVTGALHEDGLADTADGLWGGGDPARRLAVMRDSHLGVYGVVALVGTLGLRVALLAPLGVVGFARAVVCGHVLGRAGMLVVSRALPPAGGWSSEQMAGGPGRVGWLLAAGTTALVVIAATGVWALLVVAAAAATGTLSGWLFRARLGGFSGDALGAVAQIVDVTVVGVVSALAQQGMW